MMLLAINEVDDMKHDNYPARKSEGGKISAGGLEVSLDTYRVKANGTPILITSTELHLLHFMMSNAERVHSRALLLNHAGQRKILPGRRTVDVHIRHLRAALEPFGMDGMIQTVRGKGYRFSCN
jgi:two-component system phosphate regulon response regulator PhoB